MKTILGVYDSPQPHWVGDGFPVRSLLSYETHGQRVSPFLIADYVGPTHFPSASCPRGSAAHLHCGFEAVTIVYQGELEHRDSTGKRGRFSAGDVQWLTAGSGIRHETRHSHGFARSGGTLELLQLWVNLPAQHKMTPPKDQSLLAGDIPILHLADGAGSLRLIAGAWRGRTGAARTFTPLNVWDLQLRQGSQTLLPIPNGHTLAVLVLRGSLRINNTRIALASELALLDLDGEDVLLEARTEATVLLLSGEPIDEPVVREGAFVMTSRDDLNRVYARFQGDQTGQMHG